MKTNIDMVSYNRYKKTLDSIERQFAGNPKVLDQMEITFEYVVGSLFPRAWYNMQEALTRNYIDGYNSKNGIPEIKKMESPDDRALVREALRDVLNAINSLEVLKRRNLNIEDTETLTFLIEQLNQSAKTCRLAMGKREI